MLEESPQGKVESCVSQSGVDITNLDSVCGLVCFKGLLGDECDFRD